MPTVPAQETLSESNDTIQVNISVEPSSHAYSLDNLDSTAELSPSMNLSNETEIYFSDKTLVESKLFLPNGTIFDRHGDNFIPSSKQSTTTNSSQNVQDAKDSISYSETDSAQHVGNDSVLEVKLNSHTYPQAGTTDDEDLLIDTGSADYDDYEHHRKRGARKNHFKGRDYDYSYSLNDVVCSKEIVVY